MSTPNLPNAVQVAAAGSGLGAGGLAANPVNTVSAVRNGVGNYTLTFGTEIPINNRTVRVQAKGAVAVSATVDVETNTTATIRFQTLAAGPAAVDSNYYFEVHRTSI